MASACFPLTKYRWCALRCAWAKTGESGEEVGGADGARGGKIFSKTTRKLPVQLNRKQYENLFESFDYTKEATVDVGRRARREREGEREEKRTHSREEKDILSGARKQWATIRLAKRITVFTFKLNYFLRFVYHIYIYMYIRIHIMLFNPWPRLIDDLRPRYLFVASQKSFPLYIRDRNTIPLPME